jgi:hypothetical protein
MKTLRELFAILLVGAVVTATSPTAFALPMYDPPYQESDQAPLSATDIENIVSPIALYPDQLIAQILGAATYPDQVTAASNWVNSNGGLKDQALMTAVDKQPWDPSVKALTQFPTVLDQMAKNLAWTSALGDAAFNQQKDVMTAIQKLRQEAKAAGNLKTSPEIKVVQSDPQTIVIQQANPQVVYVPSYNPTVVYGTPYNPPGYSSAALVTTGLISFGVGMAIGASMNNSCCGWGYGGGGWGCNWHGGHTMYQNNVYVSRSNTFYGGNRYNNNPHYNNNWNSNRPGNNSNYNRPNNKQAWSGNNNSGRGNGNKVNVNGDVNIGSNNKNRPGNNNNNRPGNNNNANNRPGNNNNNRPGNNGNNAGGNRPGNNNAGGNRPGNNNAGGNRPGAGNNNRAAADRGFGGKPQASNASAMGGYKQGGNARADASRGRQSMGASKPAARQAPARPSGGGARKR